MNDRELLELAAKAGGYDVVWNEHWQCFQHRNPSPDKFGNVRHPWVPLDDDGDALRLAARLDMMLTFSLGGFAQACSHDGMFDVEYADDRCAAMRRAIVRAAAEIGRLKVGKVIVPADFKVTADTNGSGFGTHQPLPGITVLHSPTGIASHCVEHRSQHKNKAFALEKVIELLKQEGWVEE